VKLGAVLGKLVNAAVPIAIGIAAPESIINTTVGVLVKHKTKVNNQQIPTINFLASSLFAYGKRIAAGEDPTAAILPSLGDGALLMGSSTALHQSIKIPTKQLTGRSF